MANKGGAMKSSFFLLMLAAVAGTLSTKVAYAAGCG